MSILDQVLNTNQVTSYQPIQQPQQTNINVDYRQLLNELLNTQQVTSYNPNQNVFNQQSQSNIDNVKLNSINNNPPKMDKTFMDKYQGAIATAGLGLQAFGAYTNYKNYLENKKTMGIQRDMMKEQLKETKEEYSRIKNLRAKLNAKY